jgi:mono/diheme cytochrome c family protein
MRGFMKGRAMRRIIVLGLAASAALATIAGAQARPSVWDGVYTDDQAERGNSQFQQHCARCHGAHLAGTFEIPPLVGRFIPYWAGTTLDVLVDYISSAMPQDRPGSLSRAVNADITAFILKVNGFPAGAKELSSESDDQKTIGFDASRPTDATATPTKKKRTKKR